MVTVSLERGRFCSIQDALDFLEAHPEEERYILVRPGIYKERVEIRIPEVIITGENREATEKTMITLGLGGKEILQDGKKRGTFRTYTCFVDASDVTLSYLTIENSAGPGDQAGQAIALYADGDRLAVDSCRLLGWQDTLFTAPLPPKEIEKDGFAGPKQFAPREKRRQYYKDCYIEGEIDFIFGGAAAYFEHCIFFSKNRSQESPGFVMAPSTPKGQRFGYVMDHCCFTGNCPDQTVFLGRPWREWGKAVLLCCQVGPHIKMEGWDDWGKEKAHEAAFFAEYGCSGPGAALSARPGWIHRLTQEAAAGYTKEKVLAKDRKQTAQDTEEKLPEECQEQEAAWWLRILEKSKAWK